MNEKLKDLAKQANEPILSELEKLDKLTRVAKELEEKIVEATPVQQAKSAKLVESFSALAEQKNHLEAEMRSAASNLYAKLDQVHDKISSAESRIRRMAHQIPASEASEGRKLRAGNVSISVSKVTVRKTYSPTLLDRVPWLKDYSLLGEPVVELVIKDHVIDRMIDQNCFREEDLKIVLDSAIYTKERAPSVRFKFGDKK